MVFAQFEAQLTPAEAELWAGLDSPAKIQAFLDATPYSPENANRCPLAVLRDRQAHCLDGGLFAAAALRRLGHRPLILDILPEPDTDDDHVLALFQQHGHWGAVAKSNYTGLRFREPIYRNFRELVLSYFEDYYNVNGQKTLRGYSRPVNLSRFDKLGWLWRNEGADAIERHLWRLKPIALLTEPMAASLSPVDTLSFEAGRLGVNEAGLYQPKK